MPRGGQAPRAGKADRCVPLNSPLSRAADGEATSRRLRREGPQPAPRANRRPHPTRAGARASFTAPSAGQAEHATRRSSSLNPAPGRRAALSNPTTLHTDSDWHELKAGTLYPLDRRGDATGENGCVAIFEGIEHFSPFWDPQAHSCHEWREDKGNAHDAPDPEDRLKAGLPTGSGVVRSPAFRRRAFPSRRSVLAPCRGPAPGRPVRRHPVDIEHRGAVLPRAHGADPRPRPRHRPPLEAGPRDLAEGSSRAGESVETGQTRPREGHLDELFDGLHQWTHSEPNRQCPTYAQAPARGYPSGSGMVDAACNTIAGLCHKQPGTRWCKRVAEATAHLRGIHFTGRWPRFRSPAITGRPVRPETLPAIPARTPGARERNHA